MTYMILLGIVYICWNSKDELSLFNWNNQIFGSAARHSYGRQAREGYFILLRQYVIPFFVFLMLLGIVSQSFDLIGKITRYNEAPIREFTVISKDPYIVESKSGSEIEYFILKQGFYIPQNGKYTTKIEQKSVKIYQEMQEPNYLAIIDILIPLVTLGFLIRIAINIYSSWAKPYFYGLVVNSEFVVKLKLRKQSKIYQRRIIIWLLAILTGCIIMVLISYIAIKF